MQPKQQILEWLKRTDKETSMNKELERIAEQLHTTEPGEAFKQYVTKFGDGSQVEDSSSASADTVPLSPYEHSLGKWPDDPDKPVSPFAQSNLHYVLKALAKQQGMVHVHSASLEDSTEWLKEAAAHLMVERARQLVTYSEPRNAFTYLKTVSGNKVYTLDPKIAGYEMTVISQHEDSLRSFVQKLTGDDALHNSYRGLTGSRYYRSAAQQLYAYASWGLLAAQLGQSGMSIGKDSIIGQMEKHAEDAVAEETAPLESAARSPEKENKALADWLAAREQFQAALMEAESKQKAMIQWYELSKRCNDFEVEIHELKAKKQQVEELRNQLRNKLQQSYRHIQQTKQKIEGLEQQLSASRSKPFPLTSKLLNTKAYREHTEKEQTLYKEISSLYSSMSRYENDISGLEAKVTNELAYESKLDKKIEFLLEEVRITEQQMPEEARIMRESLQDPTKGGSNEESLNESSTNEGGTNGEGPNESSANEGGTNGEGLNESSANEGGTNGESPNESSANEDGTNGEGPNESSANEDGTNGEGPNESSANEGGTNGEGPNESSANEGGTNGEGPNEGSANEGGTIRVGGRQQYDWLPVSAPWVTPSYNRLRSELFLVSMHVHECFIRAAAAKMAGNIRLMGQADAVGQGIDKALWDSFTLLIPVIAVSPSASLSLFKGLKQEELGWLVVDKSSLASSQSAAAAVWRAKRSIVLSSRDD
ncbi:hypothetical protein [Paenibacillus senegalensis]|uniref:hypothetical protein n=1 Tax=Paenibacillus senegalensis TaxID=1465766 RepID=UPI00028916C3|nr:hypothetical protein [Paenibacillus senegalensis]